jgi:hypothetical protein
VPLTLKATGPENALVCFFLVILFLLIILLLIA